VAEVFRENFVSRGEVGAAICVYRNGRVVVDLAAGTADVLTGAPYDLDTLQLVFSTTKGMTALVAHMLVERGLLNLSLPVASYWPEFAQSGKETIPLRQLLTHEAGLSSLDTHVNHKEFVDWAYMTERLAAQHPFWPPGSAHGYHSLTYGFLVGEVVRRVTGMTIGCWFASNIGQILSARFYIGLPPGLEHTVAPLVATPEFFSLVPVGSDSASIPARSMNFVQPPLALSDFNSEAFHRAELPAINGIGSAHALARIFAAMIGTVDGVRLLSETTVEHLRQQQWRGNDLVNTNFTDDALGLGFMLPAAHNPLGGSGSFGSAGLGGSRAWALPERNLAFAYVMNRAQAHMPDPRETALASAVLACAS
jgi:CubicO group peptidase (beta-lactamase class C family)